MVIARSVRIVGALGVLVGALVHGYLYFNGYGPDDIPAPEAYITDPGVFEVGRLFIANAVTGVLLAVALLVLKGRAAVIAVVLGIGWSVAALGGFYASRNLDEGLFGFVEVGWNPSPEAAISVAGEAVGLAALIIALVLSAGANQRTPATT